MAVILGAALKADAVYSIGGQFNLYMHDDVIHNYYFLNKYQNSNDRNKYYNVCNMPLENIKALFYILSEHCEQERRQLKQLPKLDNVVIFRVDSEAHAVGFPSEVYTKLFSMDIDMMKEIGNGHKDEIKSRDEWKKVLTTIV